MPSDPRGVFSARFGTPPKVTIRSPGRVNLIGEHTDYSLLPVLPMAIDKSVVIAASGTDTDRVRAHSLIEQPPARLDRADPGYRPETWHRYLAGALEVLTDRAPGRGADMVVGGDLPPTGGLSSSSALTMATLAALDRVWSLSLDIDELVKLAVSAERHVGIEGGAMDQTVIAHAQPGTALRIDFDPPQRRYVSIPPSIRFVAAYSGEDAPKGGRARHLYNARVVGCRIAASIVAARAGLDIGRPPLLGRIAHLADVTEAVEELPEETSPLAAADAHRLELGGLVEFTAGRFDPEAVVPVRDTARHVLSEAQRVDEAETALLAGDQEALGALLDASHDSLRTFGAVTPALDNLTQAMRDAGAHGARLTGAGFGGYALAATDADRVDAVISAAVEATGGPAFEVEPSGGLA